MKSRLQDFRVKVYGKQNNRVVFLYCPFGIRRWQLRTPFFPIERLVKAGFQVVAYDFNTRAVTLSPQKSLATMDAVLADAQKRVKNYKATGITNFSAFGTSMGTQYATYCSANIPEIKKIVLNLAYGDLYEHITNFPRMHFLPQSRIEKFMSAAGTKQQLKELARPYSSLTNAKAFKGREVLMYLNRDDEVMPFHISNEFKKALEKHDANVTYIETGGKSHYRAAVTNHITSKIYLDFLNQES